MNIFERGKRILGARPVKGRYPNASWLESYNRSRTVSDTSLPCHAPFNSMYFNVHGEVGPCWLNLNGYGTYPGQSVHEIWFGQHFIALREALKAKDMEYSCGTCLHNIRNGNHVSALARLHDYPYPLGQYPTVMEFELSNRCNLECVMCKGELSSTIRKNREHLPPMNSPYDSRFVDQLEEFIPHLHEAKFLGGEPFLIEIYYEMWERMVRLNPEIRVTVTTNATVLNQRVKDALARMRFNIIVSIDSFNADTYAGIRHRGDLGKVMPNFLWFREYARDAGTYFQVSVNPLRRNWHELHHILDTCNRHNAHLWFNTVLYPHAEALWTLGPAELGKVRAHLLAHVPSGRPEGCDPEVFDNNVRNYLNLADNQLCVWEKEAERRLDEQLRAAGIGSSRDVADALVQTLSGHIMSDAYLTPTAKEGLLGLVRSRVYEMTSEDDDRPVRNLLRTPAQEALAELMDNATKG